MICPVFDYTVAAPAGANEKDPPISVKDVDANLSDRATHDIVHARPAEGIGSFEAGNATGAIVGMNRRRMDRSCMIKGRDHDHGTKHHQCHL